MLAMAKGVTDVPNPVDSYLIPIPTVMSEWVEHGEFVRLWFCRNAYVAWQLMWTSLTIVSDIR